MIPRVIHQTWKSRDIPEDIWPARWVDTWRNARGFQWRFWTDGDNRQLIADHYPWFLETYDGYDYPIKRVDAARYFILHRHGGIYADLDFVLLRESSLASIVGQGGIVLGRQLPDMSVCNAFMGAEPEHPVMETAIHELADHAERFVTDATGPGFLTRLMRRAFPWIHVHDPVTFFPAPWNCPTVEGLRKLSVEDLRQWFPASATVTLWTASWLKQPSSPEPVLS